ncbi:MAG: RagB/SusD family nutrient uptake outer membrane protein, partial [Flavobacteriaceae bacterium]|nr:RagB/SusD family nutrient uptake outer membrane protein [Flavobacteriaceae bacterium]
VPIRVAGILDFDQDLSIARNSVAEAYDLIISDLNDAYGLLPPTNEFFADRYGAKAFLARVYLQQQNYGAARDAANDVIENSGHSLNPDFNSAFNNDSDSVEDLFALQYTDQDFTNFLIQFYASQLNGGRGGDIAVEDGYLNLFDDPANDERASFFYISPDNGQLLTSKFTNQFGNIALIRLAEMHLIRAESNFRLGTNVGLDPLTEINTLRARSEASSHGSLTLDLILNERRLELAFEGHLILDIKRTQGSVEGFPFNADNLVLPIPQSEMDTNPLMEQNPGYSN